MKRAAAIAALLVSSLVAAADHRTPPKGVSVPRGCRDRGCVRGRAAGSALAPFVLAREWKWPNTISGSQLPALSSSHLVRLCRVGAAGSNNTTWDCEKPDGTSGITWSGNTGLTTAQSFIEGQYGAYFPIGGGAKSTSIADLDTTLNGAYTVLAGFTHNTASDVEWTFQHIGTGYMQVSNQGSGVEYDDGAAIITASSAARCFGGWCFAAFRSDGAGSTSMSLDGVKQTTTGAHTTITSGVHTFGNRTQLDLGARGYLLFVAYFDTNLSDAAVAQYRQSFYGVYNTAGLTGGGTGGGVYNTVTGNVDFFTGGYAASSHHLGGVPGLMCSKGQNYGENFMAADALDAASWVDVGTPTVNANVSSGPFAWYKNQGAECDEIVDDDAAALEGKQSLTGGTVLGFYTCGSFMKAGLTGTTKTKARITFETDGTASVAGCNITGLTSTATWSECQTQITGTPSYVKCSVKVGNVVGDTGSMQVCGGFANFAPNIEMFRLTNAANPGASNYSLTPSDLPTITSGGKIAWVHTPLFNPDTEWATNQGVYYMFDGSTAGAHSITEIFGYTVAGRLYAQASAGAAFLVDGLSLTPLQPYATSAEWRSVGGGNCSIAIRHDSCGATPAATCPNPSSIIASGIDLCPTQPDDVLLCDRVGATAASSLIYNAIRVYTIQ